MVSTKIFLLVFFERCTLLSQLLQVGCLQITALLALTTHLLRYR